MIFLLAIVFIIRPLQVILIDDNAKYQMYEILNEVIKSYEFIDIFFTMCSQKAAARKNKKTQK